MKRRTIFLIGILGLVVYGLLTHRQEPLANVYDPWGSYSVHSVGDKLFTDLDVPDAVITYGSSYHVRVPATGISLALPDSYEQTVDFAGFSNGDTCIKVIEDHSTGIAARRKDLDTYIGYLRHDNWGHESITFRKDFKFNGYDAFMICVSDTTSARTAIYMAFGDDTFNVSMTGTMAQHTKENKTEILNTMLTAFYQKA